MNHSKYLYFIFFLFFFTLIGFSFLMADTVSQIKENKNKVIVDVNNQSIIAWVADDQKSMSDGLSVFDDIGINEGMIFLFDDKSMRSFWMKDMNFPIDIIWISDNEVVGVIPEIPVESGVAVGDLTIYSSPEPVDKVLEVKAGRSALLNIKEGDEIKIRSLLRGVGNI